MILERIFKQAGELILCALDELFLFIPSIFKLNNDFLAGERLSDVELGPL